MRYVKLKGYKERNDMARYYRRVRAERGHFRARALWRMNTMIADRLEKAVAEAILGDASRPALHDLINGSSGRSAG